MSEPLVHGKVQAGVVVLAAPLDLPDGTEVIVRAASSPPAAGRLSDKEFRALPFFGMHRDVPDQRDGVDVVNEERAKWQLRRD